MTKPLPIVLVLGLSLVACSSPDSSPPPPDMPTPAVAKPAPVKAAAPAPAPAPASKPATDPIVAANALFDARKYAEAGKAYEAITQAQSKNSLAWFRLGYCLHVTGQLDQAIAAHTKAAEFPDQRPTALYNLGCAQALKGNPDAAFEALNKSLDSGFKELEMPGDEDLKSLRADARYTALVERLSPKKV